MLQPASQGVNPITRMAATTPLSPRERAILRAKTEHILVANIGNTGRWVATSSRTGGFEYTLLVEDSGRILCSCPAGQRGLECKHAAKVEQELQADRECQQLVKRETLSQQAKRLGISELEALFA